MVVPKFQNIVHLSVIFITKFRFPIRLICQANFLPISNFSADQWIDMVYVYVDGMEGPTLSLQIKLIGKNEILPITGHFCQITW